MLPLDEETMSLLSAKHPDPADLSVDAIIDKTPDEVHSVVFDGIDGESIRKAALSTHGGAGPSGLDGDSWRHILISRNFNQANSDLRDQLAICTKKLATEKVSVFLENERPTSILEAFLSCRLIPLDKCPGLRPIGVGEVLRRIIGKTFMGVVRGDIQEVSGAMQVCAGQKGGCEAAIHAMRQVYEEEETDAVLLMDASNAFNSINRATMLENIRRICPISYIYAYNCYSIHARLFVIGGKEIYSKEGTTQGDPPAMAFYGIGLLPLIWLLRSSSDDPARQVAYADDLTGGGKLLQLKSWLDVILKDGPKFGYHAEPTKSWLIVKEEWLEEAQEVFQDTGVNITVAGKKHLGAALGSSEFKAEFVSSLVDKWVTQIESLAQIAAFDPHSAYVAFTSALRHRYAFYMRTIPAIGSQLKPLEDAIRSKLIPALTEGRVVTDDERLLLSLPPRLGGLGLVAPTEIADLEFQLSSVSTAKLTNAIKDQLETLPPDFDSLSKDDKLESKRLRSKFYVDLHRELVGRFNPSLKRANEISMEKGASNWLTAIPLEGKDFHLNKREFWDAVNLRYTWPLTRLPSRCACGDSFNLQHALSCKKGGFVVQRHNELRDIAADLLAEVCTDVATEPMLETLSGETFDYRGANSSNEARLDVSARGFWLRHQRAFFDVRVIDPNARRYINQSLPQTYISNEREKKRHYGERVLQVENGSFTPLVFSVYGGMGRECQHFFKRLCGLLAEKRGENLSVVSSWVRTKLSFALLRSALTSVRGTRHRYYRYKVDEVDMEGEVKESLVRPM